MAVIGVVSFGVSIKVCGLKSLGLQFHCHW